MDEFLEDLGLTKLEIKIYKVLLNHGSSLAGDISKKTGIHRRNVYDSLGRLIHKGLVGYVKENNRKRYSITNPELVRDIFERKHNELNELMPSLLAKYKATNKKDETLFYRGKSGLKLIFEDIIREKKEVLVNATSVKVSHILTYFFPKYELLRKNNKIHTRMLFDTGVMKNRKSYDYFNKLPLCKAKFIDNFNTSPMSQYIYGDNVALIVWSEDPIAILIKQKEVAQGFRDSFELMWRIK